MEYSKKLQSFIDANTIRASVLIFSTSCHSVEEAAQSANASVDEFVKNICTIDENGSLVVSIIAGKSKLDLKKVRSIVGSKVRFATGDEILEKTGYPAGGTPSFGYCATFLVDPLVMEMNVVYSGGGSQNALTKFDPKILIGLISPKVTDVVK